MTQIVNFAVNNWWIFAGIALLPTLFWALWPFVYGIINPKDAKEFLPYKEYWDATIIPGKGERKHHWWEWLIATKFVRLMNRITLLWIWGYLLFLVGYGIGTAIHWLGRGIAAIYRAI